MIIGKIRYYALALLLLSVHHSFGGPIDNAKTLYNDGQYEQAAEELSRIVKKTPRDGTANYYFGASLYELGRIDEAIPVLKVAAGRNVADASRLLAICSLLNYNADEAASYMDAWETALKKARKPLPESSEILSTRILNMRNMLERVEKIEIIDSISVDSASFFKQYRISEAGGRILPPDAIRRIGAGKPEAELSLAYVPQSNTEIIWAETDTTGLYNLYGASILDDGTIESSKILGDNLGEGGDAKFPFMMPDGVTLYYANNGENSIGGYDIFMTRRTDDGSFFQPQNLGMPYNSTANDYMLAIDEVSGLGWWATDRNSEPGKVTIYIFAPSNVRVNVDPGDENLTALARLSDISLTQKTGIDYREILLSRLPAEPEMADPERQQRFNIDMGNGRVYTRLSEFKNNAAKSAMLEVLACEAELRKYHKLADGLRSEYRTGNLSVESSIKETESTINQLYKHRQALRNKVIRLEK